MAPFQTDGGEFHVSLIKLQDSNDNIYSDNPSNRELSEAEPLQEFCAVTNTDNQPNNLSRFVEAKTMVFAIKVFLPRGFSPGIYTGSFELLVFKAGVEQPFYSSCLRESLFGRFPEEPLTEDRTFVLKMVHGDINGRLVQNANLTFHAFAIGKLFPSPSW